MMARKAILAVLEGFLYLVGVIAAALLLWHTFALMLTVTIGPQGPLLEFPIQDQWSVFLVVLSTLPSIVIGSVRLRGRNVARLDSSFLLQAGTGVLALAMSYRFLALLVFFGMMLCRLRVSSARRDLAWHLLVIQLLLSLAPIDISLRSADASPKLVSTANCETSAREIELNRANRLICVAGGPWMYSEPRWVIVW